MSYNIAGMVIKNEYLALGTIISTIGIAYSQMGGSSSSSSAGSASSTLPPVEKDTSISAGSSEEENFIRQFVAEAEKGDKKH